jgi:hypothetical protein
LQISPDILKERYGYFLCPVSQLVMEEVHALQHTPGYPQVLFVCLVLILLITGKVVSSACIYPEASTSSRILSYNGRRASQLREKHPLTVLSDRTQPRSLSWRNWRWKGIW